MEDQTLILLLAVVVGVVLLTRRDPLAVTASSAPVFGTTSFARGTVNFQLGQNDGFLG